LVSIIISDGAGGSEDGQRAVACDEIAAGAFLWLEPFSI
jgi:hypothetical protein